MENRIFRLLLWLLALALISHTFSEQIAALPTEIASQTGEDSVQATRPRPFERQDHRAGCASCQRKCEKSGLAHTNPTQSQNIESNLSGIVTEYIFLTNDSYDSFGNPITEIFTGDLQGNRSEDSYHLKREFSQDGRNLLMKEETEEGKITTFEYLPNTNLVTLKLIKESDHLLIQEAFQYDDCHHLIRKSTDNGKQKTITDYILRQQQPFLHMPEWIEEKYLDRGTEHLLKRTHLQYDLWGNVVEEKIYDANGTYAYSILKEYNERGDILSETNPSGQKRLLAYDAKGRCIASTNFSQKLKEERHYDTKGRVVEQKEIGAEGVHTTTYAYDCNDDLIQKTDSYGNIFSYSYDPLTHKIIRSDAPPILTNDGQVAAVAIFSTYDPLGREISKTDANGHTTLYHHNAYGLPVEITYPNGSKEIFRYTKSGRIATHTNREGLTTVYTFDILGRVTSKNYGDTSKESYTYDSCNLLEKVDLNGNSTHYIYDGAKRKIQEGTRGRTTEYSYDALGRLSTIDKETLRILYKRDVEGRILEESQMDRSGTPLYKISHSYNADGDPATITRYINNKEATDTFTYDAFRREIEHQDTYGNKTTTLYNENHINNLGQKVLQITTVDPKKVTKITTQDPLSRITKEETLNPLGVTIALWEKSYNPNGYVTHWKEHVYADGHYQNTQCTHFTHTTDNKVASITRAFGTPHSRTTHYTYTPGGKVERKTLPDGITLSYTYNPLGFLHTLNSSDNRIHHRFECTKKGELTKAIDAVEKITIQREIDPFGNVTQELFPNSIEIKKSYDSSDRPTTLQISHLGSISYTYDPLYLRSVSRFSPDGKLQYTHHYESYDLDGNLLAENMIFNSGKIQHSIDKKGRKTEISSPYFSQKCLYDACNNLIKNTIDQTPLSYTYDDLSQLISENDASYRYDSLFNRREKNDQIFQINSLNELARISHTFSDSSHTLHDDLASQLGEAVLHEHCPRPLERQSQSAERRSVQKKCEKCGLADQAYDLNGNQTQKGDTQYIYDPLNRLIEATLGEKRIRFLYDPLGRRLTKIVLDKTANNWSETYRENYLYDGTQEIGALAPDGTPTSLRILGLNIREEQPATIAIELKKQTLAPLIDYQGNICRLVNPLSKTVSSRYEFSSFGEMKNSPQDDNPWRYAAKRLDPELNLIYYGKRYYDPELARWLTTDPAGFADSLNPYQYAFNNPYSYYDPNGEFVFALALPFVYIFAPVAAKACLDALIIGVISWGVYEGTN
jgi:RHS repeat-associated protein